VDTLIATLEENLATLRDAGEQVFGAQRVDAAEHFTRSLLAARRAKLEARADAGLVRDCHGDLRAEHVIAPAGGQVYVYDCVEFDPALRQIDVSADLAFLVMDLTSLGARAAAMELVEAYRRGGGDPGDDALLSFFAAYRAWVRAKIASLRALELPGRSRARPWRGRGTRVPPARAPVRPRAAGARGPRGGGQRQDHPRPPARGRALPRSSQRALVEGARDRSGGLPQPTPFPGREPRSHLELVEALRRVAESSGATVAQVAIAWVLSQGEDIVPLVGARRRDRLEEALGALGLDLSEGDLDAIAAAVPPTAVAGERYDAQQMAILDSER
jgi:hypothetical protein